MSTDQKMLEELKKIREALEPKPAPPEPAPPKGLWNEFKDFLSKYKVLPLIGLAIPGLKDLATYSATVGSQAFGIGDFLVALITFIIVAFVIFLVVKIAKRWGME